jgi:Ca-activated chloride channel family protein
MSITFEVNDCPWNVDARLVRIGLRGRSLPGIASQPVARDVKLQVELNPARVVAYRLIGYENRSLRKEDGRKVAGELRAGETVTALYEIIPPTPKAFGGDSAEAVQLRYQRPAPAGERWDLLTVEARYKLPGGWLSKKRAWVAQDVGAHLHQASADFRFAAAVAAFGMILRGSPHRGTADLDLVLQLAGNGLGEAPQGARRDFLQLVRLARDLQAQGLPLSHR